LWAVPAHDYDVIVIGSGFGGSVTALRLTEKGYRVGVLEAGRRFGADDFPKTNWNLRDFLWLPRLGMRGIQRLSLLKNLLVLSGAGVGGGSLVYANVLIEPHPEFYTDPQWGHITDWKSELAPYYERARQMLGVAVPPFDSPADGVMRAVAEHFGVTDTYEPTPVGVWFGQPGVEVPDPYFGGTGPTRTGCIRCGGCMVGCRFNAKNSLDFNYLYHAEAGGAVVHAETEVTDVRPLPQGGYEITARRPGPWRRARSSYTAAHVVFAAGALGTVRLLLAQRERGRLPGLSERVGHLFRTNSEAILGATAPDSTIDYSAGVAISSSIRPTPDTRIEPVRYPKGSNAMGLLGTILVGGGGRLPRPLRFLLAALRHPVIFLRSLSVYRWSEHSVILLVMQSRDNSLRVVRRRWRLSTKPGHGEPNPTYLPVANEAARAAAVAMGGFPGSSLNEVLLRAPVTAHPLGGASIGDSAASGVVDAYHRVYGCPGLHVVDGAAVGANPGSNPSLTITAMAERAMAMWPNRGEADHRPPLGEAYRRVAPA
jgi:cholesterol oxidase